MTGLFTENPSGNEEEIIALVAQYVNETILPKKLVSFEIVSATQPTADGVQASIKGTVKCLFYGKEEYKSKALFIVFVFLPCKTTVSSKYLHGWRFVLAVVE